MIDCAESATPVEAIATKQRPLISVITAVRNGAAHIAQTIDSVAAQDYPNVEHIVIDGASTDGTQEVVKRFINKITHFVSEPDRGLADAWNKGLRLARGDYIAFLNADDFYLPGFLSRSLEAASASENEVIYGAIQVIEEDGTPLRIVDGTFDRRKLPFGFCFRHPECLTHRALFERVGMFDEAVRIAVDADFMLRCVRAGASFRKSRGAVCMRRGGLSDRYWRRTTMEYLSRLEAHGLVDANIALMHRWLVPVRVLNRKWGIAPKVRRAVRLVERGALQGFHFLRRYLPTILHAHLYRAARYRIESGARIARDVRFSRFGALSVGRGAWIGSGVLLDNHSEISVGPFAVLEDGVAILTSEIDPQDPLGRSITRSVAIGEGVRIGAGARVMPGSQLQTGHVVSAGEIVGCGA